MRTRGDETTRRTVDDEFLDLICNDADLLAAEFQAIIATEWHEPPADGSGAGDGDGQAMHGPARPPGEPVHWSRPAGDGGWIRQRSPPGVNTSDRQEGR